MLMTRGIAWILIIITTIFIVEKVFLGGGVAGWYARGYADENYVVMERNSDGTLKAPKGNSQNFLVVNRSDDGAFRIPNGNQTVIIPPPIPQGVVVQAPGYQDVTVGQMPIVHQPQQIQTTPAATDPSVTSACGDKPCGGTGGFRPVIPNNDGT